MIMQEIISLLFILILGPEKQNQDETSSILYDSLTVCYRARGPKSMLRRT